MLFGRGRLACRPSLASLVETNANSGCSTKPHRMITKRSLASCRHISAYTSVRPKNGARFGQTRCRGSGRAVPFSSNASADGGSTMVAFDRKLKLLQRDGAALAHQKWKSAAAVAPKPDPDDSNDDGPIDYDYFRNEVASRLVDRLDDIKREGGFPLALDLGSGPGYVHRAICADDAFDGEGGIGGVRKLVQLDSSERMIRRDGEEGDTFDGSERCGTYRLMEDEEGVLPFPDGTFDLVLSSASLHWVNDLPRLLSEARRVLKPDGCIMFAMVGGSTLSELRSSLVLAEMERDGGVSTHVGPFVDFADVGQLLTAAGFTLPTVDIDTIKFGYPNAMVLMEHLQRMGEGNACANRRGGMGTDAFLAAACIYDDMYRLEVDHGVYDEESVEASVQVIYAIGWTPHDSQQKPLERGSATLRVGEVVDEKAGGDGKGSKE